MKRICISILLLSFLLSGCRSWTHGSFESVEPHITQEDPQPEDSAARNYSDLRENLLQLVRANAASGSIRLAGYQVEGLTEDLDKAISDILENDPLAAYAVKAITYDPPLAEKPRSVTVSISYHPNRTDLQHIRQASGMEQARALIEQALDGCDAGLVMQISNYRDVDYALLVQTYADSYPGRVMEQPMVIANVYPDHGENRVVELVLTYKTSREALRQMRDYVQPVFEASRLNVVAEADERVQFEMMYSFLVERNSIQQHTSITPAYSLLRYGVGDNKAVAQVFAAMCVNADMTCLTVSGTRDGHPHYWNIIGIDGTYWHVDILRNPESPELILYRDADMAGYVWDYQAYPPCVGEIETQ